MEKINDYLNVATEGIFDPKQKQEVKEELEDHIMERYEEYKRRGFSEEEAEERAVGDMGDKYEVREQMGKLHSFLPRVYYQRTALILLFGLLLSHFYIDIGNLKQITSYIGIALTFVALVRFYPLGWKAKVAFWGYTLSLFCLQFVRLVETEWGGYVGCAVMATSLTFLGIALAEHDGGRKEMRWLGVIEWCFVVLLLLASQGAQEIAFFLAFIVALVAELILVSRFARRASRYEWKRKRGLNAFLSLAVAAGYAIFSCVPVCYNSYITRWTPESREWTEERKVCDFIYGSSAWYPSSNYPSVAVYSVPEYLSDEDYDLLNECKEEEHSTLPFSREDFGWLIHRARKAENAYCVAFYYCSGERARLCNLYFDIRESVRDKKIRYRHFYRENGVVYEYDAVDAEEETFYLLQGRECFGYAFIEWKDDDAGLFRQPASRILTKDYTIFTFGKNHVRGEWNTVVDWT